MYLRTRLRFAGAEGGLRVLQRILNPHCGRVRATEHAPRDPCRVFERRHGLAEIVERRAGVLVARLRVIPPHLECESIIISMNTSRHGHRFAHQCPGFFEAL